MSSNLDCYNNLHASQKKHRFREDINYCQSGGTKRMNKNVRKTKSKKVKRKSKKSKRTKRKSKKVKRKSSKTRRRK